MALLAYALATLADTKSFLGINNSSNDSRLEMLINMATVYLETLTNRRFASTVYTDEKYDGTGKRELQLKKFPIISFTQLQKNRATDNSDDWETIDSSDYWVDNDNGIITMTSPFLEFADSEENDLTESLLFELGKNKYRATYTAGHATVPHDIQMACILIVGEMFNTGKASGVKRESLGDHSVEFASIIDTNPIIKNIISGYKDIQL